jgi:pantoate--beta-alanine ligase
MAPRVLRTLAEVVAWRDGLAREGKRLALVPTMGFLHEGHLSLMREGGKRADVVAVTLFVNPTQFGPKEDLSRYPRDLAGDLRKCESAGVSAVYAPEPSDVYPPGFQTFVDVTQASQGLDGERRPGHFRGVATVVTQFLCLFRPNLALFGEKDFQQLQVIRALERDLKLGVEIVGLPTVREPDGLAMSSRNAYLSAEQRSLAACLSEGLKAARDGFAAGERQGKALEAAVRSRFREGVKEDYVAVVDAGSLQPIERVEEGRPARVLVAAFVGSTRLIDNAPLG